MSKTAMQELIDRMNDVANGLDAVDMNIMGRGPRVYQLRQCVIMAVELMGKEKEQIKDAWDNGDKSIEPINAELYYTQTFTQ